MARFITLILFFFLVHAMWAQHPYFYKIDDEAGLPSNEVYEIIQDDFGYIWIGCDAGLYRYDGFRFKGYTNRKQNGKSISYLRKDTKGRIWCKNFNGQIYRVEGDSLRIIIDNSGLESTASQFTLDDSSNLWVANKNIIEKYTEDGKNKKIIYKEEPSKNTSHFLEIIYFKENVYFTKSGGALNAINVNTNDVRFIFKADQKQNNLNRFNFSTNKKNLFLLAEDINKGTYSVFQITDSLKLIAKYAATENNKRAYYLCFDNKYTPWLCTGDGSYLMKEDDTQLQNNSGFLKGEKISFMLQDKEGDYWFTSLHNGIFVIPHLSLKRVTSQNTTLPSNNLSALKCLSDESIMLGTYTGQLLKSNNYSTTPFANKFLEKYGTVKKIIETDKYVFASRIMLSVVDKKSGKELEGIRLNARDFILKEDSLFSISYAGFSSILIKDLLSSKKNISLINLRKTGGRALHFDTKTGNIFIAFNDGFFSYANGTFQELLFQGEHIYVQGIGTNKKSTWLLTSNNGILCLEEKNVVPSNLSKIGIDENNAKLIYSKDDLVFVTSNTLLYIYNLKTKELASYATITGINAKDITAIDINKGQVYLATNKGLTLFPIDLPYKNTVSPQIKIDSIEFGNEKLKIDSLIILPYINNKLTIHFASVALRSRGTFFYEYRLKELDSSWTKTKGSENYALFSSIPPGRYTFEVRSSNESGLMSNRTVFLNIEVESPFWQKWWFYAIMIILTAAIVTLLFIVRIRIIERRSTIQQNLTNSQLAAINAQMNPHFMYNTLNSIQDLILKSDVKSTNYYLSRFSSLMRKILEASQHNTIALDEEIEILELYLLLEKLRFGDDFTYTIDYSRDINTSKILIPSIIIQPFLENAIKHGLLHKKGNKVLNLKFQIIDSILFCEIIDNGVGRKKAAQIKERSSIQHKSFATDATEKRLALINSTRDKKIVLQIIDLETNNVAEGTKITLSIPL